MRILFADCYEVKVDDCDYTDLVRYKWHVKKRTNALLYVYRYEKVNNRYAKIRLHQQLMGFPQGRTPDHRNGDPLDNQRHNLRLATQQQQAMNTRHRNGKRFKGVSFCPTIHGKYRCRVPWRARIRVAGKLISLGFYSTEEAAAQAYNNAALKHFGEFACLNDISGVSA